VLTDFLFLTVKARKQTYDQSNALRDLDALTNEAENGTKAGEDDDEDEEKEGQGSGAEEEDYDDEEDQIDDNDYGQNYFDNGEGDDMDDDDGMYHI
jgi:DNA-directed RNA polymerase III subunit RPC7